jgi:hypothetical protein
MRVLEVIWVSREQKSFCREDWTGGIELIPQVNFPSIVTPDDAEPVIGRRVAPTHCRLVVITRRIGSWQRREVACKKRSAS